MSGEVTVQRDRLVAAVQRAYGLPDGPVRSYAGEHDVNLRHPGPDGADVLIKVSPPGTSQVALAWQQRVLDHLQEHQRETGGLGFEVPRVLRTGDGDSLLTIDEHQVRVLTWVPGALLSDLPEAAGALLADMGRTSAVLTAALEPLEAPPGLAPHAWMAEHGEASLERALERMPGSAQVDLVRGVLEFHRRYAAGFAGLPRSTVHQDLNDHNLLVEPDAPDRVRGVIDFNDAVHTIRVADVAIAASYGMRRPGDPLANLVAVVDGYLAVRELTGAEREVIFPIAVTRLCVNWAIWRSRALSRPTAYGDARSRTTWPIIERVLSRGLETAHELVLDAYRPARVTQHPT